MVQPFVSLRVVAGINDDESGDGHVNAMASQGGSVPHWTVESVVFAGLRAPLARHPGRPRTGAVGKEVCFA